MYATLREKISAEKAVRSAKYAGFERLYAEAVKAGQLAGQKAVPFAMIVGQPKTAFGSDIDFSKPTEYVADGVCGFAWVTIKPATSSFARWLVKQGLARPAYGGGVQIWIHEYNQSMQRKEAHAGAMAAVLREGLGLSIYSGSRMD